MALRPFDSLKDACMARLQFEEPDAGFCHFPVGPRARLLRRPHQREACAQVPQGGVDEDAGSAQRTAGLQDLGDGGARRT